MHTEFSPNRNDWLQSCKMAKMGDYLSPILTSPAIFISSARAAGNADLLTQHKINIIISLELLDFEKIEFINQKAPGIERFQIRSINEPVFAEKGIRRYFYPLKDSDENSQLAIRECFELFEEICRTNPEANILIHCKAGLSRSVIQVVALIAKGLKISCEEAAKIVAAQREIAINHDLAEQVARELGLRFHN